jgi:hypothetical protein
MTDFRRQSSSAFRSRKFIVLATDVSPDSFSEFHRVRPGRRVPTARQ